jgi:hypothetical protein
MWVGLPSMEGAEPEEKEHPIMAVVIMNIRMILPKRIFIAGLPSRGMINFHTTIWIVLCIHPPGRIPAVFAGRISLLGCIRQAIG